MIREVKVRPRIEEGDYSSKLGHIVRFLENGEQVKLVVVFRGRELKHPEAGEKVLLRFAADLEKYANAGLPPVIEGREMFLMFMPKVGG